jgi:hypothetical protein
MWSQRSPAELPSIAAAATGRRTGEFSGELSGLVEKKSRGRLAVPAHYKRKSIISQACHVSNGPLCMPVTPGPCRHNAHCSRSPGCSANRAHVELKSRSVSASSSAAQQGNKTISS